MPEAASPSVCPGPADGADRIARALDSRLPWAKVSAAATDGPPLAWHWGDLSARQAAGEDPTSEWRAALTAATARQYATPPPPAMPAAFVLQWALEVPATVGAYAALLPPPAGAPELDGLSFALHRGAHFPVHIQIDGTAVGGTDPAVRLADAHAAYVALARPFAASYQPGVRLGRHQRAAMVDDVWAIAVHRAGRSGPGPLRSSCCFIYALPGVHECAGCPRLRHPR